MIRDSYLDRASLIKIV